MAYQPKSYRKLFATAATASMVATVVAPVANAAELSDLDGHRHEEAILALIDQEIISGYPDGTYRPDKEITRAEGAILIARALGLLDGKDIPAPSFSDVKEGSAAYEAIAKLEAKGIISGFTDGTYRPDESITREAIAKYLVLGFDQKFEEADGEGTPFKDVSGSSALGKYVEALYNAGVTNGVKPDLFGSKQNMKRGDFAAFTYKTINLEDVNVNPEVESVSAINLKEVKVTFNNENYDAEAVKDEANYTLKDADGNTIDIDSVEVDGTEVTLVLTSGVSNQTDATLTVDKEVLGASEDTVKEFTFFDADIPVAQGIELVGPNEFKIIFSEPIKNAGSFSVEIENGIYGVADATPDGTNEVLVTLSANSLSEGEYKVKVSGYEDFAGYKALTKEFTLDYVKDKAAPTAEIKEASQTEVVVKFDKKVTDEDGNPLTADYFYHTFTSYQPDGVSVSADGTEYTLTFTTNPLPEGQVKVVVDYDANDSTIQDAWGNKMTGNAELTANIVADKTAPEVTSVKVEDEQTIEIYFSEDVDTDSAEDVDNYVFKDADGEAVTPSDITYTADLEEKEYKAIVTFAEDLNGNYTVEVKNVEDKALSPNKLVAVTKAFNVADLTGPTLSQITAVGVEGTSADYIYVTFPEKMATTGQYSVLNKDNYLIGGEELADEDKIEIFKDTNKVKITIADKDRFDFTGSVDLTVGRLADAAGNRSADLSEVITVTADASPVITAVKQIDYKTVEIVIDQPLKTVVADGFTIDGTETLAAVSWEINDDNETVITGTLKAANQVDPADSSATISSVAIVANKLVSETGYVVDADTFMAITDGYAPFYAEESATQTDADEITLSFSESLATTANDLAATELIITDEDNETLTAGLDYSVTVTGSDIEISLIGDYAGYDGELDIKSKEKVTYIYDVSDNKLKAFDTITVDVATAPNEVTSFAAADVSGASEVDLTWDANTEQDFDHYELYLGSDDTGTLIDDNLTVEAATIDVTGEDGNTLTFAIYAVDAAGNKSAVATATVTVDENN